MTEPQTEPQTDPRRQAILQAAISVCCVYGFRKTSMADIAKAVGISRPALYQHFANKEAIVRAAMTDVYADKIAGVAVALGGEGPAATQLRAALLAEAEGMEDILSSPHGGELLDASGQVGPDIAERGEAELMRAYAGFFDAHGIDDPAGMSDTLWAAKRGAKNDAPDYATYLRRLEHLAVAFGALLRD